MVAGWSASRLRIESLRTSRHPRRQARRYGRRRVDLGYCRFNSSDLVAGRQERPLLLGRRPAAAGEESLRNLFSGNRQRRARKLISGGTNTYPSWAPDGKKILFRRMVGEKD